MTIDEFVGALRIYCYLTGGSVTSWGRTPIHNAAVGGVAYSPHLVWLGADVVYDVEPNATMRAQWANRLGLLIIHEPDHDHLQPSTWRAG